MEPTWVVWLRDNMPQDLFADMRKENTGWRNRAEKAEAEVDRLRGLCFDLAEMASWLDGADLDDVELIAKGLAAGRGEG